MNCPILSPLAFNGPSQSRSLSSSANHPVANAPQRPAKKCMPKASKLSSYPNFFFKADTPKNPMIDPTAPTMIAPVTSTNPAAGVIATSPATTPEAAPRSVVFL